MADDKSTKEMLQDPKGVVYVMFVPYLYNSMYIGSSENLLKRMEHRISDYRSNVDTNNKAVTAVRNLGFWNFVFMPIWRIGEQKWRWNKNDLKGLNSQLRYIEKHMISKFKPKLNYNTQKPIFSLEVLN